MWSQALITKWIFSDVFRLTFSSLTAALKISFFSCEDTSTYPFNLALKLDSFQPGIILILYLDKTPIFPGLEPYKIICIISESHAFNWEKAQV